MNSDLKQARALILEAIKKSGDNFGRSYYRKAPKRKVVPILDRARNILLTAQRRDPRDLDCLRLLAQVEEEFCRFPSAIRYLERYQQLSPKTDRKLMQRLYRLREHQKKADMLPISPDQLEALGEHIERCLASASCDHSLRHAASWARLNRIDEPKLLEGLEQRGGYCDCEVLFNVLP